MTTEPLARLAGSPERLATVLRRAALASEDTQPHEEILTRIHADRVETPASAPGADQVSYCEAGSERFDELSLLADRPVEALFSVTDTLAWHEWLSETADHVVTVFEGEAGVAHRLVHRAGDTTVTVPCVTDWDRSRLSFALPDRFDGAQFLDADGHPMPTTIETDAAALTRLTTAVERAVDGRVHPLVVEDGQWRLDLDGSWGPTVRAPLPGRVTGPDVRNTYGPDLARVAAGLEGSLTLQTGPGADLAVVQDRPGYTLRYVLRAD